MKRLLILTWLFLCVAVSRSQEDVLNQAITACLAGDYQTAVDMFETAVSEGAQNGHVYYDLGVCYARAGQQGMALVNLLRAARYLPRDENVNIQIDRLRAERADLPEDESDALTLAGTVTGRLLTFNELAALALSGWIVFFAFLSVYWLRPGWQVSLRLMITMAALVLLAMLALMGSRLVADNMRPSAVVVVASIRAMSGPGDDYLALFTLSEAAEVRILDIRNGWNRVVLPGGRQGWIHQEAVQRVDL